MKIRRNQQKRKEGYWTNSFFQRNHPAIEIPLVKFYLVFLCYFAYRVANLVRLCFLPLNLIHP